MCNSANLFHQRGIYRRVLGKFATTILFDHQIHTQVRFYLYFSCRTGSWYVRPPSSTDLTSIHITTELRRALSLSPAPITGNSIAFIGSLSHNLSFAPFIAAEWDRASWRPELSCTCSSTADINICCMIYFLSFSNCAVFGRYTKILFHFHCSISRADSLKTSTFNLQCAGK